jgi:hypothetical protein
MVSLRALIIPEATSISATSASAFDDPTTPQARALEWLSLNKNLEFYPPAKRIARWVLAVFYYSTEGDSWTTNSRWLSDFDECTWYIAGLPACSSARVFANLVLGSNNVQGTLPAELAILFGSLEKISIRDGSVSGSIPTWYGLMTRLTEFDLRGNNLDGEIPTEVARLTSLQLLDLNSNALTGRFPMSTLASLTALMKLDLGSNQFTGTLSNQLGSLTMLSDLNLEDNQLRGPIPTQLGDLVRLVNLNFADNDFIAVPRDVQRLLALEQLSIQNNNIGGTLHTEFGAVTSLQGLYLAGNSFGFRIPTQIGRLTAMREMDLSRNRFIGSIPSQISQMPGLSKYYLQQLSRTVLKTCFG